MTKVLTASVVSKNVPELPKVKYSDIKVDVAVFVVAILKVVACGGIVAEVTPIGINEDDATYPPAIPLGLTDSGTPRRTSETLLFSGMFTGGILGSLRKGL